MSRGVTQPDGGGHDSYCCRLFSSWLGCPFSICVRTLSWWPLFTHDSCEPLAALLASARLSRSLSLVFQVPGGNTSIDLLPITGAIQVSVRPDHGPDGSLSHRCPSRGTSAALRAVRGESSVAWSAVAATAECTRCLPDHWLITCCTLCLCCQPRPDDNRTRAVLRTYKNSGFLKFTVL